MLGLIILLILMSLVVHEMGHWALLHRFGVPVVEYGFGLGPSLGRFGKLGVKLFPIAAYVEPEARGFATLSPGRRALVAIAGPFFSLLYGFALYLGFEANPHLKGLELLAYLNWTLAFVNMIPFPPFDGWHVFRFLAPNLPASVENLATRLGNGLVYGLGFFILGKVVLEL